MLNLEAWRNADFFVKVGKMQDMMIKKVIMKTEDRLAACLQFFFSSKSCILNTKQDTKTKKGKDKNE